MSVPLLVVSPHLDDAVLSCGRLLAANPGSVVVTVLAGSPPDGLFVDWDRRGGFRPGDDVIAQRRREDRRALRLLRARPVWLEFRDDAYRDEPLDAAAVRRQVTDVVESLDPSLVAVPLGIRHP
ncbi:MAG: PIG-L family deacetylase, partial [Mycobacteriales bacterium]